MRESFARDERAMARPVSEGDPGIDVPRSHADSSATGNTRANRWRIETLRSLDRWRSQVTWSALGLAVSAQSTPTQSRLEAFFSRKSKRRCRIPAPPPDASKSVIYITKGIART